MLAEAGRVLRPGGTLLPADFLMNTADPYFTRRYRRGAPQRSHGAFEVDGAEGDATIYVVRHFTKRHVLGWFIDDGALMWTSYTERRAATRTGRPISGFLAHLRRR